jgi:hypothetical protein
VFAVARFVLSPVKKKTREIKGGNSQKTREGTTGGVSYFSAWLSNHANRAATEIAVSSANLNDSKLRTIGHRGA